MVYSGGSGGDKDIRGSRVSCDDSWAKRTDSVLDSASDLYSDSNIFSVCASRLSFCPTLHFLLTT